MFCCELSIKKIEDTTILKHEGQVQHIAEPQGLKNWTRAHINDSDFNNYSTCYQGVMMVSDSNVRNNPRKVYENIENELSKSKNPEAGHYMERLMHFAYAN